MPNNPDMFGSGYKIGSNLYRHHIYIMHHCVDVFVIVAYMTSR